jgi:hypothetical protein
MAPHAPSTLLHLSLHNRFSANVSYILRQSEAPQCCHIGLLATPGRAFPALMPTESGAEIDGWPFAIQEHHVPERRAG